MTVSLDATPLTAPHTGIARYTIELIAALRALHPEVQFTLDARPDNAGLLEGRWWSIGLPRRLRESGAALFHGTDFAVPLTGRTPSVVTVHDLSPLRAREWNAPATARRVARRLPGAVARSRAVIVPSARVKQELVDHFHTAPEKIFVTPLAAADVFQPKPKPPREPYLIYVGSAQQRKNVQRLLSVFKHLRDRYPLQLVLVGKGHHFNIQLGVSKVEDATDEELAQLYSGASALIYPSIYEGFGLPVVEAMACGCPVAVSRNTAAADVAGDAALLFDPESETEMESAIRTIIERPATALEMHTKGLARAKCFSWKQTAEKTWEAYESALSRS